MRPDVADRAVGQRVKTPVVRTAVLQYAKSGSGGNPRRASAMASSIGPTVDERGHYELAALSVATRPAGVDQLARSSGFRGFAAFHEFDIGHGPFS